MTDSSSFSGLHLELPRSGKSQGKYMILSKSVNSHGEFYHVQNLVKSVKSLKIDGQPKKADANVNVDCFSL